MKKFKDINIVLEDKVVFGDLILENNLIKEIKIKSEYIKGKDIIVPGFIDVHTHGGYSYDAMDGSVEAIKALSINLVKEGITSYLPTTMTQSNENILKSVEAIGQYFKSQDENASKVLGIHVEGPYISVKAAGAQPIEYIRKPNIDEFEKWQNASGNIIKKVSYAPENDDDFIFTKYLKKHNIVPSIAHTIANYKTTVGAMNAGATSLTHTYSAMTGLHHREVGVVGAAFLHDQLISELIFDKKHVTVEAAKILLKNKTTKGVILITDSMRGKGLPEGVSELGGQTVYIKNKEARLKDGTLAGSILAMIDGYKNLVNDLGLTLYQASHLASLNAAKELSLDNEIGSIKEGKIADLVVLNENLDIKNTIVNGKIVYEA